MLGAQNFLSSHSIFLPLQTMLTLMKCNMIRHFIWVYMVCESACLDASPIQRVNFQMGLIQVCHWGQKWSLPGGHMFYIPVGLYRENIKKSCLKPLGIDIMYVASSCDLSQMFVQIWPKVAPPLRYYVLRLL